MQLRSASSSIHRSRKPRLPARVKIVGAVAAMLTLGVVSYTVTRPDPQPTAGLDSALSAGTQTLPATTPATTADTSSAITPSATATATAATTATVSAKPTVSPSATAKPLKRVSVVTQATPPAKPSAAATKPPTTSPKPAASGSRFVTLADYTKNAAAYRGDKVVYYFDATWCPMCQAAVKDIKAHASQIPADVVIVQADFDKTKDLQRKWGVTQQSTAVLLNANGGKDQSFWAGNLAGILSRV
jgi:hypothetical protein